MISFEKLTSIGRKGVGISSECFKEKEDPDYAITMESAITSLEKGCSIEAKLHDYINVMKRNDDYMDTGIRRSASNEDLRMSAENVFEKVIDFIKKMFRKLVEAVTNLIRSAIAWFNSVKVVNQMEFYEQNKGNVDDTNGWRNKDVETYDFKLDTTTANKFFVDLVGLKEIISIRNLVYKFKHSSATQKYGMVRERGNVFQRTGAAINKATGIGGKAASADGFFKNVVKELKAIRLRYGIKDLGDDANFDKETYAKSDAFVKRAFYGSDTPTKVQQKAGKVIKKLQPGTEPFRELSRKDTGIVMNNMQNCKKVVKILNDDLKTIEELANKYNNVRNVEGDETTYYNDISHALDEVCKLNGMMVRNLFGWFAEYTKMRTVIYNIFLMAIGKKE